MDTYQCYHVHQLRLSAGKFNKRLFEFDFFPPIRIIWKYYCALKFWIWILASGGCYQCELMVCGFWGTVFFAGWVLQYRHWVYYQLDSHGLHHETQQQLVRINEIHWNPSIVDLSVAKSSTVPKPKCQRSDQNVKTGWYHARQVALPHFPLKTKEEENGINWFQRLGHSFDVSGQGQHFEKHIAE